MNLTNVMYWRNGEVISAQDLNTIQYSLSFLDNKICDEVKISNTGQLYKTQQGYTISNNIVYDPNNNWSVVNITPTSGQTIVGILTVADSTQSYSDIMYTEGSTKIFIPNYNLSSSVVYVTYFYTTSTLTFSNLITNINTSNLYYPAIYVFEYQGNSTFAAYEYPISTFSKYYNPNLSSSQIGTVILDPDINTEITTNDGNVSFTVPAGSTLGQYNVSVGDIFYFTLLVPEPQLFGSNLGVQGALIVNQDILPVLNGVSNIGSAGSLIFDPNTQQYTGIFKRLFNNIVANHLLSDDIRSDIYYINQINNIIDKRLFLNPISGEIYPDNKDIYVHLDTYNESMNTGVSFKVGHHGNFSYNLNLNLLTTTVSVSNLQNLSYSIENISTTSTPSYRIGYFTNISSIGDVVYLNKHAVIDFMSVSNPQLEFTTDSYNYAQISLSYIDLTNNLINITVNIQNYIDSVNINNIEYYRFLIYNTKNVPYFSSGSINNFTSYSINFRTFIVPLMNLNLSLQEIQVNGFANNLNITLYNWSSSSNSISQNSIMTLNILDYDNGVVEISPLNTASSTLSTLVLLSSLSFIYPTYKLSVKNDSLTVFTKNGYLSANNSINYNVNGNKFPLVTYIASGMLNFNGTSPTQTINLPLNISNYDIEVLLTPLLWQYANSSSLLLNASMNLTYAKNGNSITVTFSIAQNSAVTQSSTTSLTLNNTLYKEALSSTATYNTTITETNNVINAPATNNLGFSIDLTNNILRIPTSLLPTSFASSAQSLVNEIWRALNGSTQIADFNITSYTGITNLIPSNITVAPPNINGLAWNLANYGFNVNSSGYTPLSDFTKYFSTLTAPFGSSNYSNYFSNIHTNVDSSVGNGYWAITPFTLSYTPPPPPKSSNTRLSATAQTTSSGNPYVSIDWNGNSQSGFYVTNLTLYRSTSMSGGFTAIASTGPSVFYSWVYNDYSVSPTTTYYYYVVESGGVPETYNSNTTNTVSVTTGAAPTPTPTPTTFTITGTVLNASTNLPISGVNIINYNTGLIVTTSGNNGNFTIAGWSTTITIAASALNYTFAGQTFTFSSNGTATFYGTPIQQPAPQPVAPTLSINGPSTVNEGTPTTYSVSLSNGSKLYNIQLSYNTGGGATVNSDSFTTDINGNSLSNLLGATNKVYNFTMGLNILDKVNENANYNQSITATLIDASTGTTVTSATYNFTYVASLVCQYTTPVISLTPNGSTNVNSGTGVNFSYSFKGCQAYYLSFSATSVDNLNDKITLSIPGSGEGTNVSGILTVTVNRNTTSPQTEKYFVWLTLYAADGIYVASVNYPIYVSVVPPTPTASFSNVVWRPENGQLTYSGNNTAVDYVSFTLLSNVNALLTVTSANGLFSISSPSLTSNQSQNFLIPIPYNNITLTYPNTLSDTITVKIINTATNTTLLTIQQSVVISVTPPPPPNPILQLWNNLLTGTQSIAASYPYNNSSTEYHTTWTLSNFTYLNGKYDITIGSTIWFDPSLNGVSSAVFQLEPVNSGFGTPLAVSTPTGLFGTIWQTNNAVEMNIATLYSSSSGCLIKVTITPLVNSIQPLALSPTVLYLKTGTYTTTSTISNIVTALSSNTSNASSPYTTNTTINSSVGADTASNLVATLQFYTSPYSNVSVYLNGNNITSLLSTSYPQQNIVQYSGNVANYIYTNLFNELLIYTDNNLNSGLYDAQIIYNGNDLLNGATVYYVTKNMLLSRYLVSAYNYTISPITVANSSLQMTSLVQLQNTQVPVTTTQYSLTSNYQSSSSPLTFTLPLSSTPDNSITSVTLYYGTNLSNLQSYTHLYNNILTLTVSIYCTPTPNSSTSTSPYTVKTVINWGDGTTSNFTTASTASDVGTFNIVSAAITYMSNSVANSTIPAVGTVKYLILGKTV